MAAAAAHLGEAAAAFGRGDHAAGRAAARAALAVDRHSGAAQHLLALCERRLGNIEAALAAYAAARAALPGDAQVCNNFANLLGDLGRHDEAIAEYQAAIALAPGYGEAWCNFGLTLQSAERIAEAVAALTEAARVQPARAATWRALGLAQRAAGDSAAAAAALDQAIAVDPSQPTAWHARALVEGDLGGDARAAFARARQIAPGDCALLIDAAAFEASTGHYDAALAMLRPALQQLPDWVDAHIAVARLRWQAGDRDGYLDDWSAAIAARPADTALALARLAMLGRAGRWLEVAAGIGTVSGDPRSIGLAAVAADETGESERAATLFARLPGDDAGLGLARVRHLLRTGQTRAAAALAEVLTRSTEGSAAWAYLASAWRLLGDPRHEWLEGDARLVSVTDLDMSDLGELAGLLRRLHVARAQPLEQSLRGGTQTTGRLFSRAEPMLLALRDRVASAVAAHIAQLPPRDPDHPTLRQPRGCGIRFSGSWSVRLAGDGFHVAHIHSEGWLSSVCYIALPPAIGTNAAAPDGWLTLGEPPAELGLALPPLRLVEPKPGRLVLFPSTMWHSTRPFAAGERLTVAFDVVPG